ncbi:hypothetical protein ACFQ6N_24740 [Kitasatospora sp. NPDC056446]|uniref:hypothetical protein n=1 Tax=Kitasatospora sp. NPDC056446 TaxID=3345819 RepID=UPI0036AF15ED
MTARRRVRLAAAGALLATVLLATGCSHGGGGSDATGSPIGELSGAEPSIPPLIPDTPGDPSKPVDFQGGGGSMRPDGTMILPLDAYLRSDDQKVLATARTTLAQECMRAQGLELPSTLVDRFGSQNPSASVIYGVIDMDNAKVLGYRMAPAVQNAVQNAAPPAQGGGDVSQAQAAAYFEDAKAGKPGCAGEARAKLGTKPIEDAHAYVQNLKAAARTAARRDSRVTRATAAWSACMKATGVDYADPTAPAHDRSLLGKGLPTPPGASLPPPSPAEIAVAVADVGCKRQVNYLQTVTLVTATYERILIDKHAQQLHQGEQEWEKVMKAANKVLVAP